MRKFRRTALLALAIAFVAAAVAAPAARAQASQIESIAPASGRAGDRVTIRGRGFGSHNVQVAVNGVAAEILSASGHEVLFVVPAGTRAGVVPVIATNPGGQTGSVDFRLLEGALLKGHPAAPVADALTDLRYTAAAPADVDSEGVILTRLDVRLTPEATVGQLNAALAGVNGGIVAMQPGVLTVVVAVPRQPTPADLQRQADLLAAYPGIRLASPGRQPAAAVLPFAPTDPVPNVSELQKLGVIHHLLPARFPAAWNAAGANQRLLDGCQRIPVIVLDFFGQASTDWISEFPAFAPGGLASDGSADTHGFDASTTIAARFDAGALTGANPFHQCLQLRPLSVRGSSFEAISLQLSAELRVLPAGKVVVNQSIGFKDDCPTCVPADIPAVLYTGLQRGYATLTWKEATSARWNDFAIAVSAGNDANKPLAGIYDAFGRARYSSPASISTTSDPLLAFAGQGGLFVPPGERPEFPSLAASVDELITLASDVRERGLDLLPPAFNAILVGSAKEGLNATALVRSAFSDFFPDLHTVGECVPMSLEPFRCSNGTSFAAPQVAGLLSYLWLLSPELRNHRSSSEAVRAIQENVRTAVGGLPVLDAYAAVLSLDAAGALLPATASIRIALLDADGNGSFTDDDLDTFLSHYFDVNGLPLAPTERDYSQFDLNGDGFTGGARLDRFDLDRAGSTRFGQSLYTALEFDLGGERVSLNENAVSDLQILCYYAYSPLYLGSAQRRETLLANRCAPITVSVDPAGVTLAPGGAQQFAAAVRGTTDPRVTWVVPSAGGTVSASGVFTAGPTAGTFAVRAISVVDPNAFAEATVTIIGAAPAVISGNYDGTETRGLVGNATDVDTRVARWGLFPDNGSFKLVKYFEGTGFFCGTGVGQCTPEFSIANGQFQATVPGKAVTGSLTDGRLRFVLHEPCGSDTAGQTVTCFTAFDGTLLEVPVTPTSLDFGIVPVGGTSASQFMTISNPGLLSIQVAVSVGAGFTMSGNTGNPCFRGDTPPASGFFVPPGFSCRVAVQFTPTIQGNFTGTLTAVTTIGLSTTTSVALTGRTH